MRTPANLSFDNLYDVFAVKTSKMTNNKTSRWNTTFILFGDEVGTKIDVNKSNGAK